MPIGSEISQNLFQIPADTLRTLRSHPEDLLFVKIVFWAEKPSRTVFLMVFKILSGQAEAVQLRDEAKLCKIQRELGY